MSILTSASLNAMTVGTSSVLAKYSPVTTKGISTLDFKYRMASRYVLIKFISYIFRSCHLTPSATRSISGTR